MDKICLFCNKKFHRHKNEGRVYFLNVKKYCSIKCGRNNRSKQPMQGKKHLCGTRKKMSLAKTNFIPWNKGKRGIRPDTRTKFRKRWLGHLNPNWNGGTTPLRKLIRELPQYQEWRKSVFERDNYVCIIGRKEHGNKLNVDHIMSFKDIMKRYRIKTTEDAIRCKKLWDISNGRTLCLNCHKQTLNYLNLHV